MGSLVPAGKYVGLMDMAARWKGIRRYPTVFSGIVAYGNRGTISHVFRRMSLLEFQLESSIGEVGLSSAFEPVCAERSVPHGGLHGVTDHKDMTCFAPEI